MVNYTCIDFISGCAIAAEKVSAKFNGRTCVVKADYHDK